MIKQIAGIPTYVINEHHEAYHLWKKLGIKRKSLVHVDAHHDMWDEVEKNSDGTYSPNCANYLLPAIRQRMIKEVWWINPFSVSHYCLNVFKEGRTPKSHIFRGFSSPRLRWNDRAFVSSVENMNSDGNVLRDFSSYILDIDLDAFSCFEGVPDVEYPYSGLRGKDYDYSAERDYSPRISRVLETVSNLSKPEMIVIAKSQGKWGKDKYIGSKFVRPVKKELVKGLEEIFCQ